MLTRPKKFITHLITGVYPLVPAVAILTRSSQQLTRSSQHIFRGLLKPGIGWDWQGSAGTRSRVLAFGTVGSRVLMF